MNPSRNLLRRPRRNPPRRSFSFFWIFWLLALPVLGQGVPIQDLSLAGVTLVQNPEQIRELLGTPVATHQTQDSATGEPASIRIFPQLTAYFVKGEAMRLKTTDPETSTLAGARVGDRIARVLELYAPATPRLQTPNRLELQVDETEAVMAFHLYRGRVTAIEILLDY